MDEQKCEIIAFSDNDKRRYNTFWMGKPIISPKDICNYKYDYIIMYPKLAMGRTIHKQDQILERNLFNRLMEICNI